MTKQHRSFTANYIARLSREGFRGQFQETQLG